MAKLKYLENLRLAWYRILTGQTYFYRNFQRIELEAFAWALDDNLLQLRNELTSHAFEPSESTKIFLPKQSGLLRPITILRVRDAIIYQAIANIISEKARNRLAKSYFKTVFSSILSSKLNYRHFFRDWKYGRRKLSSARKEAFNDGYVWIGNLDLASFFDVIDHKLLAKVLSSTFNVDMDSIELLVKCLPKWTIHPKGYEHGHGVPQGPLASSLMAECLLHKIDEKMSSLKNSVYLRYVDDITIMATSERAARILFARLDVRYRSLGLVPVIKTQIYKASNIEDLMIDEPSPPTAITDFTELGKKLPRKKNDPIRKEFLSCFQGNKLKEREQLVTRLKFALFRMNADRRMLNKVFLLFTKLPCIYEAINFYLRKFGRDKEIGSRLITYIESKPLYDIVLANCIETLYFTCVKGQYNKLRAFAIRSLSSANRTIKRCTGVKILGLRRCQATCLCNMLSADIDVYLAEQLLVTLCDMLPTSKKEVLLNGHIRSTIPELALTSAYLLTRDSLKLSRRKPSIAPWATPILARFGFIKKKVIGDRIGEIIKKRYAVKLSPPFNFRKIFRVAEYKQALIILNSAEGSYDVRRVFWLVQMDCFNQLVLYRIFNKKLGMAISYVDVFGSLSSKKLKSNFPNLAKSFEDCHKRRSSSFVTHVYSKEKNRFTTDLKVKDRGKVRGNLKIAYQELVDNY